MTRHRVSSGHANGESVGRVTRALRLSSESFDLGRLRYDVTPVHVVGLANGSPAASVAPDVVDEPAGD